MKNPDFKWSENSLETRLYIQNSCTAIPVAFEVFLYQNVNYLNTITHDKKYSFYLFRTGKIASVACIHFIKNNTCYKSPERAPFGGIQCDKKASANELTFLMLCVENWFSSQTDCTLTVKTPPAFYNQDPTNNLLTSAYDSASYKITNKFINYYIPVSESAFSENIIPSEVRRLVKSKKSGFRAGLYDGPNIEIVYNFVRESRAAKGYLMSMTLVQLQTLINNFPEQCQVFVVTDEGKIIALTLTILVCKEVLYNFLPADLPDYKSFSPMVYLTEAVYNYCQKENIAILDLGIALDNNGNEKPGLLKFKQNLGGKKSFKITYEKKLKFVNQIPIQLPSL